mgnify:CR=1 FL=1
MRKPTLSLQLRRGTINTSSDSVVLFVDTEGVSLERMEQILGDVDQDRLLLIRPSSLSDLHQTLTKKLEQHDEISLIVVDTINAYVRLAYIKNKERSERQFLEMTSILQPLAEKGDFPVFLSAQVYEKDGEIDALVDLDAIKAYQAHPIVEVRYTSTYDAEGVETIGPGTQSHNRSVDKVTFGWPQEPDAEADPYHVRYE